MNENTRTVINDNDSYVQQISFTRQSELKSRIIAIETERLQFIKRLTDEIEQAKLKAEQDKQLIILNANKAYELAYASLNERYQILRIRVQKAIDEAAAVNRRVIEEFKARKDYLESQDRRIIEERAARQQERIDREFARLQASNEAVAARSREHKKHIEQLENINAKIIQRIKDFKERSLIVGLQNAQAYINEDFEQTRRTIENLQKQRDLYTDVKELSLADVAA